jgi:octaprenyl-diphosphate synthase
MRDPTKDRHLPAWAAGALEGVRGYLEDTLPRALQPFLDTYAYDLPGMEQDSLRPYLLLLVARHYGSTGIRPLKMAVSIQMIHLASVLHDRLGLAGGGPLPADGSDRVRHQREALDILLGDFFFSKASNIIVEDGDTRIIEDNIQTSLASAETQAALVIMEENLESLLPSRCFRTMADKKSLLVALSLRVGAILGRAPQEEEKALSEYGVLLGRVARIAEDLGFWRRLPGDHPQAPGEIRFSHPLILLWEREGRSAYDAARQQCSSNKETLRALGQRLEQQGYLEASMHAASAYAEKAVGHLAGLKETEELAILKDLPWIHLAQRWEHRQEASP